MGVKINDVIDQLSALRVEVETVKRMKARLMDMYFTERVLQMTSNPSILNGLRGVFDSQDDESFFQRVLDAMDDTNNSFIANIVKHYKVRQYDTDKKIKDKQLEFRTKLEAYFSKKLEDITEKEFDKFLEKVDGDKTGRFVQEYDWVKFYDAKNKELDGKGLTKSQWVGRAMKWYSTNEEYNHPLQDKINQIRQDIRAGNIKAKDGNNEIVNLTNQIFEDIISEIRKKHEELDRAKFLDYVYANLRTRGSASGIDIRTYAGSIDSLVAIIRSGKVRFRIGGRQFVRPVQEYMTSEYKTLKTNDKDFEMFNYLKSITKEMGGKYIHSNITEFGYIPSSQVKVDESNVWDKAKDWVFGKDKKEKSYVIDIDGNRKYTIPFQMINLFNQEEKIKIRFREVGEKYEDYVVNIVNEINKAYNKEFNTLQEVLEYNKQVTRDNLKAQGKEVDTNLAKTIFRFIGSSMTYEFKKGIESEMLESLDKLEEVTILHNTGKLERTYNHLKNKITGEEEQAETVQGKASNIYKHYKQFIEMIVYDEFEADEGQLTKWANRIQKITSAKGMWLNPTGALNNIVYGKIQTAMESTGKYYWEREHMRKANKDFFANLSSIITDRDKEFTNNKLSSLLKYFDIIEMQDEKGFETLDEFDKKQHKWYMKTDNFYFMHHMGEVFMQNTALMAMMQSHRVINGKIQSFMDYKMQRESELLSQVLTPEEKGDMEEYIKDRYSKEQYKDAKLDYVTDYIRSLPKDRAMQIVESKKTEEAKLKEEFEANATVESIFELKDGVARPNVDLDKYEIEKFRNKVLKVNQSMHGIYTKIDANTIQHYALGRLAMQFKKFLRPGWNRRFGSKFNKSYWNEGRAAWDKGMYISFKDYLNTGVREELSKLSEEDRKWFDILKGYLIGYGKFATNFRYYYKTLDDFEKANVNRTLLEMGLLMTTIALLYAVSQLKGDDDDEYFVDATIYQLDRLYSELFFYTPAGWLNEGQKLMKNPAASFGTVSTIWKMLFNMFAIPFRDDEGNIYQTGVYKDEYKAWAEFIKLVPVANQYQKLMRIDKSNRYYALFRPI